MIFRAFLIFLIVTSSSHAATVLNKPDPKAWGSLAVVLEDNARDSCWTNLSASQQYAADKLAAMGFDVVEWNDSHPGFYLYIRVNAFRFSGGGCVGNVEVGIQRAEYVDDRLGVFIIAESGNVFIAPINGNESVTNTISALMDKIRDEMKLN